MSEEIKQAILAMLSAIDGVEQTVRGQTLDQYTANWQVKHAVERGIEIISEASRRLSQAMRDNHPEIDWRQVHGIGNILRHDYDEIVDEVIFGAANNSLPPLKTALLAMLADLDGPRG